MESSIIVYDIIVLIHHAASLLACFKTPLESNDFTPISDVIK